MIPLATTSVSTTRADRTVDAYDPDQAVTAIASGIRAVIHAGGGTVRLVGGQRVVNPATVTCDPFDLRAGDTMTDDQTGQTWTVLAVSSYPQLGLGHLQASLRSTEGAD